MLPVFIYKKTASLIVDPVFELDHHIQQYTHQDKNCNPRHHDLVVTFYILTINTGITSGHCILQLIATITLGR